MSSELIKAMGHPAAPTNVALAISFGSQGLVQDVVIGPMLIFSDAMDVGDMVEIYANTTVIVRVEDIEMKYRKPSVDITLAVR